MQLTYSCFFPHFLSDQVTSIFLSSAELFQDDVGLVTVKKALNARILDYLRCPVSPVMLPLKSNHEMFLRCSLFAFRLLYLYAKKCMLQF